MIRTLLQIEWIDLKRDRVALFLTFVLPLVFFSVFGLIFTNMGGGGGGQGSLDVLIVDEDGTAVSRRLAETLGAQDGLEVSLTDEVESAAEGETTESEPTPWTRDSAHAAVRKGRADAAVILPRGLEQLFANFGGQLPEVEILYDAANPMAQFTVAGLLHAASFQSSPDLLMQKGLEALETWGGALTPEQQAAVDVITPQMEADAEAGGNGGGFSGMMEIKATAAHADEDDEGPLVVAYYAAGIAVMFLLFSMTGAAGGLLEEEESGTLERLLTSNVTMGSLLASRWAFYGFIGFVQVTIMFVWGWAVFGLDLWEPQRLLGFFAMTAATAAAAAGFGLVLAALCKSRAQLSGLSTVVILLMSALGGSMVPRFVMPEFMTTVSKFTFNGWALDGYLKVFWYTEPDASLIESLVYLLPQLGVLIGLAVVFYLLARRLARRWEIA